MFIFFGKFVVVSLLLEFVYTVNEIYFNEICFVCAGMETASGGVVWAWFSWLSQKMLVQAVFLSECVLTLEDVLL
jgi:hypothetical protein